MAQVFSVKFTWTVPLRYLSMTCCTRSMWLATNNGRKIGSTTKRTLLPNWTFSPTFKLWYFCCWELSFTFSTRTETTSFLLFSTSSWSSVKIFLFSCNIGSHVSCGLLQKRLKLWSWRGNDQSHHSKTKRSECRRSIKFEWKSNFQVDVSQRMYMDLPEIDKNCRTVCGGIVNVIANVMVCVFVLKRWSN